MRVYGSLRCVSLDPVRRATSAVSGKCWETLLCSGLAGRSRAGNMWPNFPFMEIGVSDRSNRKVRFLCETFYVQLAAIDPVEQHSLSESSYNEPKRNMSA